MVSKSSVCSTTSSSSLPLFLTVPDSIDSGAVLVQVGVLITSLSGLPVPARVTSQPAAKTESPLFQVYFFQKQQTCPPLTLRKNIPPTRVDNNGSRVFLRLKTRPSALQLHSITLQQTGFPSSSVSGKHALPCPVLPCPCHACLHLCLPAPHPDQPIQALASDAALDPDHLHSLEREPVSLTKFLSPVLLRTTAKLDRAFAR